MTIDEAATLQLVGSKRVSVLVNPAAGGNRGLSRTRGLVAELADRGWTVDLLKASGPADVANTISAASESGMTRLILAGGDGLVHHALPALVGSPTIVGIVPVGTGNDFCRGLGLSTKRKDAIAAAVSDQRDSVDVISVRCGGSVHFAASVVTAGFSGRVNARANDMAARRGFPSGASRYSMATLAELVALEPLSFSMSVDGRTASDLNACLIAIGNTRYFGGGMAVCPEADFRDGAMEVITIDPVSKSTFARVLPLVFSGRYVRHRAVQTHRCRTLRITTSEPLWADGERLFRHLFPQPDGTPNSIAEDEPEFTVECGVVSKAMIVAGVEPGPGSSI